MPTADFLCSLNHVLPFLSAYGTSPMASGLWLLCGPPELAQPRAHADHLPDHALCRGGLQDLQLLVGLELPCRSGRRGCALGASGRVSSGRCPEAGGQGPGAGASRGVEGQGQRGSGLGSWDTYLPTCLHRHLTTEGVILASVYVVTWEPLAENQDPGQDPHVPHTL